MNFEIGLIQKTASPSPFALLSTKKEDGSTNLMAISWWTFASNHPPMVAVCLSNKGLSSKLIKATGEFGLNLVDPSISQQAFRCGTCSGASVNKAQDFSVDLAEPSSIETKLVKQSHVSLECRLVSTADASDHTIYIAEIADAHINETLTHLYAFDGYARLDTV